MKNNAPRISRRQALHGLGTAALLAAHPKLVFASGIAGRASLGTPPALGGRVIELEVAETPVDFNGKTRLATTINGSIPAPTIRLIEGDDVTIRVTNRLPVPTSIHWHGILLPFQMDGVPGISFSGIAPGDTFTYRFKLRQSGTYWYHSHSAFQEMTGMYGALIVEPRGGERIRADRDHAIVLSDWTDEDPMRAFAKLKVQSDVYNYNQPTVADFVRDVDAMDLGSAFAKRRMWNRMRMSPTDLADLSNATLTYLMNGLPADANWTGAIKPGERVRLRFINGASNTFYDVRIPGLPLTVVHVDGHDVEPATVDEFRFGPGETCDVLVKPEDDAYTVFAQSQDRTGFARGTLAARPGLAAPVPALDAVEWLTMSDMMGAMAPGVTDTMEHPSMSVAGSETHGQHGGMTMNHGQHAEPADPLARPSAAVRHARTEYGPSVDMRVDMPRTNLDDPGIGLRNNGRRVLTLDDLKSLPGIISDERVPTREIELHLTGNMERYSWSIDGLEFGKSTPVSMPHGQRIRVILQNDTMMSHPMHLHGMWSELETADGELRVRRHTIPVQPAQRLSFLTTPNDVGRWAWHCHLLFHMDAGMFREVVVA